MPAIKARLQLIYVFYLIISLFFGYAFAITDWTDIGPPSAVTLGVYCHPTDANVIYFMADTGHLFRSMDKGNTWQRISQKVAVATMPQRQYRGGEHAVAADRRADYGSIVYFSPGQIGAGLWKSTDYGDNWSRTPGPDGLGASVVAVDYDGVVYCLTGGRKFYVSTDGGENWTGADVPFYVYSKWYKPVSYRVDIEVATDNVIWVTTRYKNDGIYFTADKGQTWTQKLAGTEIVDIACSPVDPNLILALEQDGRIFRSGDGGATFEQTGKVRQNDYWSFNTWPPHRGGISVNSAGMVIAIGRYSMARSTDGGLTFTETMEADVKYSAPTWPFVDRKTTDQFLKCCDLSSSPVDSGFWIFGDGAMLKISTDGGLSWEGGKGVGAHGLWMYGNPWFDAEDPNVFHVACVDFGHAYTTDLGKTWHTSETGRISCQGVTQDPNDPNIYYKMTKKNNSAKLSIFKSTDRGHTFTKLSTVQLANDSYGGRIFVDPTDSRTIYCTIRGGKGVYKSTDGGSTFSVVYAKENIHQAAITKSGNVFFHIWNGSGLYRYIKATDEWKNIAPGYAVDGFAVHPEDENIIFMNAGGRLYKSVNGLDANPAWEQKGSYAGRQLYIDPYKPQYMLMMTEQKGVGMLYSQDGGENWETIQQNLGTSFVWGFVPGGPAAKGRVYAFDATAYYIDDLYNAPVLVSFRPKQSTPESIILGRAYPNPFNAETKISIIVRGRDAKISLVLYDVLGRRVKTLLNDTLSTGEHFVSWDGRDDDGAFAGSGIYFVELYNGRERTIRKITLLK